MSFNSTSYYLDDLLSQAVSSGQFLRYRQIFFVAKKTERNVSVGVIIFYEYQHHFYSYN